MKVRERFLESVHGADHDEAAHRVHHHAELVSTDHDARRKRVCLFVEEPLGVTQRSAEHFGEAAGAKRFAEMHLVADLAQLGYRLPEIAP